MTNKHSPFHEAGNYFKSQPIAPFRENTALAKKYIKTIQDKTLDKFFIGWICERDSFFAYLFKYMKNEARNHGTTKFASKIARAGFPIIIPKINNWISKSTLPVLMVPVPSRYGVSEKFAIELYKMLGADSKKISKIRNIFTRSNNFVEIKKIDSWAKRKIVANNLFFLKKKVILNKYNVLLVDDMITSGSSLKKCANLLKKCGAKKIAIASLATNMFDKYSYK